MCGIVSELYTGCTGEETGERHTAAGRPSRKVALRGGRASRTYRRAFRPPNGWNRIYEGIGRLYSLYTPSVSILGSLISHGTAMRAIRSPQGVIGDLLNSSRRHHPLVMPYRLSGPYGKFITTVMQRLVRTKKTVGLRGGSAGFLSDFTVAGGWHEFRAGASQVIERWDQKNLGKRNRAARPAAR